MTTDTLRSFTTGELAPLDPAPLPGAFARIVTTPPVDVAAPRGEVWRALTELDAYPEWCPFTRRIEARWELGAPVRLHLNWDPRSLASPTHEVVERLSVYEPPRALGWSLRLAGGLLRTERIQYLEEREAGVRYHTHDRFVGPLAPLVVALYGARTAAGFAAIAAALKRRVEGSAPAPR